MLLTGYSFHSRYAGFQLAKGSALDIHAERRDSGFRIQDSRPRSLTLEQPKKNENKINVFEAITDQLTVCTAPAPDASGEIPGSRFHFGGPRGRGWRSLEAGKPGEGFFEAGRAIETYGG
jgi:hypothetical protein